MPGIRRVRSRTFRGAAESRPSSTRDRHGCRAAAVQNRVADMREELPADTTFVDRLTPAAFPV